MGHQTRHQRLGEVLDLLGINASQLSRISGADHSLISKWYRGDRALTRRSKLLRPVCQGLLAADTAGRLDTLLAPYRQQGESAEDALCEYLTGQDIPALVPRNKLPQRPTSGEYTVQYRVYLGRQGFRSVMLHLLDYTRTLPPGLDVYIVCHGRYEWIVSEPAYMINLIAAMQQTIERGNRITVINRKGYSIAETAAFALPWLAAHLRGTICSRYYEGDMPAGDRFVAAIPGYCSYCVKEDPYVEDGLFAAMYTDPLDIRRDTEVCLSYLEKSHPASQYQFLAHPEGAGEDERRWLPGPLPGWQNHAPPKGNYSAICRLPSFGLMTQDEFAHVAGNGAPEFPTYLFSPKEGFAPGKHRLLLCREDLQEALAKQRVQSEPLSLLLHRKAYVPRDMLRAQLKRLVAAMGQRRDVEVAILPRCAFQKLELELVSFENSVSVAWQQTGGQSVYARSKATSGSFYGAIDYVWDKLLAGWKRPDKVRRQLRKWVAGQDLQYKEPDSAIVRGWSPLPRGR